jgi:predicted CXXCH cytochrome family protein
MNRPKNNTGLTVLLAAALVALLCAGMPPKALAKGSILNSPHNLSVSGGSGAHAIAYDEIRVCVFCHTPHNARNTGGLAPLWNRALPSEAGYTMYDSDVFRQKVLVRSSVPTGSSRICLSCHDGTLALNSYGGPVLKGGGGANMPITMPSDSLRSKNANLTRDLSDDHPISFEYSASLISQAQLVAPGALPPEVHLDKNSNMQCTSCHDPHDNEYGNFLVMNNGDPTKPGYSPTVTSPLCVSCHTPSGWDASSPHYAGAGCLNCHVTHGSPVKQYLLAAPVDQLCYNGSGCHGSGISVTHAAGSLLVSQKTSLAPSGSSKGSVGMSRPVATYNMESVFSRALYRHPVGTSGATYQKSTTTTQQQPRVECADCHNSHVAGSSMIMGGGSIPKSLKKVVGVSKDSMASVEASAEYQICYKCHSGSSAFRFVGISKPNRVINEPDQMKRFDSGNPSFHPVAAIRRNDGGRSLLATIQNSMYTIACSDCHNSDQSKKAGGDGPNGPHGSRYEHILLARYEMPLKAAGRSSSCSSYQAEYALCFTCHSDNYVMLSGSYFSNGTRNEHFSHVVDRCIPCFACHDPHGVPYVDGATAVGNAHLINFDRGYAASQSLPVPSYLSTGSGSGSCTVACHSGGTHSYRR